MTSISYQDSEYEESKPKQKKRRKNESISPDTPDLFGPLLLALWTDYADESKDDAFDQFMEPLLESFSQSRQIQADRLVEVDQFVSLPSIIASYLC